MNAKMQVIARMGDVYAASIEAGLNEVLRRIPQSNGSQPTHGPPVFAADVVHRTMMLSSALFFIFGRWPGTLFVKQDEIESCVAKMFTSRDDVIGLIGSRPFSKNTGGIQRGFLKSVRAAIWSNADAGAKVCHELADQMRLVSEAVPYFTEYFTHKNSDVYIESLADSLYMAAQHIVDQGRTTSVKRRGAAAHGSSRPVEDAEEHRAEAGSAASASAASASAASADDAEAEEAASPKKVLPKKRPAAAGAASAAAARPAKRVVKVTSTEE